jgi:BirA family biotin operon repressor/biotin-[acetyl-CoA-carboxylase] ligase
MAVIGVGINVSNTTKELPTPDSSSLALRNASTLDRSVILRAVCRTLESLFVAWCADEGDPAAGLGDAYRQRCSTLGREVRIALPGRGSLTGHAVELDAHGRLVVAGAGSRVALGVGDVVHVAQSTQ